MNNSISLKVLTTSLVCLLVAVPVTILASTDASWSPDWGSNL
jgi:hypothetical protein